MTELAIAPEVGLNDVSSHEREIIDSIDGVRDIYEGIDHPLKEQVLHVLCALTPVDGANDHVSHYESDDLPHHDIVEYGIRYFGIVTKQLATQKAEDAARRILEEEYDAMTWAERQDRGWISKRSIRVNPTELVIDTASLGSKEIFKHLITTQMKDAFNVAYQGTGRLPFRVGYSARSPVDKLLTAGIILAKHVGSLTQEELFAAASSFSGDGRMVGVAYSEFVAASKRTDGYQIDGMSAGYGYTRQEAGYAMFRARRHAASYVIQASQVFWKPEMSWDAACEGDSGETPHFSREETLFAAADQEGLQAVACNPQFFGTLDPELFLDIMRANEPAENGVLLWSDYGIKFDKIAEAFRLTEVEAKNQKEFVLALLSAGHMDIVWSYYKDYCKAPIAAMELFRSNISEQNYIFTEAIVDGNLTPEHHRLGITETGRRGIEQLKRVVHGIQSFIARPDKSAEDYAAEREKIEGSPVYEALWLVAVRFDQAIWGEKNSHEIVRILTLHEFDQLYPERSIRPLDRTVYHESGDIQVAERKSGRGAIGVDAMKVIDGLLAAMKRARFNNNSNESYEDRLRNFHASLVSKYIAIEQRIAAETGPETKLKIAVQLERYASLLDGSYLADLSEESGEDGFLAAYDKIGHLAIARDVLLEKALRDGHKKFRPQFDAAYRLLDDADGEIGTLSAVSELIDHLLVQEYLLKLRPNDKAYGRFVVNKLARTSAVRAEISSVFASSDASEATRTLRFTPNRDVGLELSGQIGDACWASKYVSIARDMPNMTAVLISEAVGEEQRLVGSALFLEAQAETGEKLLIIRGINPIQNLINELDALDFLGKYLTYAEATAQRAGRKLAIVIDHCGGASTNRPTLFNAISLLHGRGRLTEVSVPEEQVRFNNYDLEGSVFLVASQSVDY